MNYIAWDTETTGLPMGYTKATPDNVHLFDKCRMLTLAFVKYSSKGREVSSYHGLVYPDTFEVPPESTKITVSHITKHNIRVNLLYTCTNHLKPPFQLHL